MSQPRRLRLFTWITLSLVAVTLWAPFGNVAFAQSSGGQAGLVIEHGDGSIDTYCVAFPGNSITGAQLLANAGIPVIQWDGAVCAVGNNSAEGCFQPHDFSSCYCKSDPPTNTYWAFFTQHDGGGWIYSSQGFETATLQSGDMQAWKWGVGGPSSAPPPPAIAFSQVCKPPVQATAAPPTATPPPPTATPPAAAPPRSAVPGSQPTITPFPADSPSATARASATNPPLVADSSPQIRNHGTATATPVIPIVKNAGSGAGPGEIAAFVIVITALALASLAAYIYRRRRDGR